MSQHLSPEILARIEASKKQGGIELDKLAVGTKIEAQTKNTLYRIAVLGNGKFAVEGGSYFPQLTETYIAGSTWGGSMIKINWMAIGMHHYCRRKTQNHCSRRIVGV